MAGKRFGEACKGRSVSVCMSMAIMEVLILAINDLFSSARSRSGGKFFLKGCLRDQKVYTQQGLLRWDKAQVCVFWVEVMSGPKLPAFLQSFSMVVEQSVQS